jgi:predicted nucleotidyltransferase
MKYKLFLNDILGQKSKLKALRYLLIYQNEISIRELSRKIGITQPNLSTVLKELEHVGVLKSKKIGTSLVFKINHEHFLVKDILCPLFQGEKKSVETLSKFILKKIKFDFISIILFGSIARGEEDYKSDIDLAIIIDNKYDPYKIEDSILEINPFIIEKFGNTISPVVISKKEFQKKYRQNNKLIRNIVKEGKLISGKLISDII